MPNKTNYEKIVEELNKNFEEWMTMYLGGSDRSYESLKAILLDNFKQFYRQKIRDWAMGVIGPNVKEE